MFPACAGMSRTIRHLSAHNRRVPSLRGNFPFQNYTAMPFRHSNAVALDPDGPVPMINTSAISGAVSTNGQSPLNQNRILAQHRTHRKFDWR